MTRLAFAISMTIAVAAGFVACGDDGDDTTNTDAGGGSGGTDAGGGSGGTDAGGGSGGTDAGGGSGGTDAGGGSGGTDASVAAMCKGTTFGWLDRTRLGAMVSPGGACASSADLDVVCNNDVGGATRTCGQSCFVNNPSGDDAALATCTSACVRQTINPAPSDACGACYLQAVSCTLRNCVAQCAADPNAMPCLQCQIQNRCLSTFFTCSGLPAPPTGTGGAGMDASAGN